MDFPTHFHIGRTEDCDIQEIRMKVAFFYISECSSGTEERIMNGLLPISLNVSIQQQLNPNIDVVKELEKSKFLPSYL